MKESQAKAKAIEEALDPLRAKIDQLEKAADDEGIRVTRETTEAALELLTTLHTLNDEAVKTRQPRTVAKVQKEQERVRAILGFTPRRRQR